MNPSLVGGACMRASFRLRARASDARDDADGRAPVLLFVQAVFPVVHRPYIISDH